MKLKPIVNYNIIGPCYLRTLGIPLLKGRDFSGRDTEAAPAVALINQAMARKFWPNENPIGARISTDKKNWASIEGVVGDVRQLGLRSEPTPEQAGQRESCTTTTSVTRSRAPAFTVSRSDPVA